MVRLQPGLRWEFFFWGKDNAAYHRHVIMGFDVPNPRCNVDVGELVTLYGCMVVEGKDSRSTLFETVVSPDPE
jgi:hypothetical protein